MDDVYLLKDNKKLYEVLGVPSTATQSEIKRSYHKLAIQFHPDKNPNGAERFKEISFAYNILSDEEQRTRYDSNKLKEHIQKEYDPNMDPTVELTAEQLRSFVDSLRRNAQDAEQRRREFDDKKREEMRRREEFDRAHPQFQMPHIPQMPSVVNVKTTSAELHARYSKHDAAGYKYKSNDVDILDEFTRQVLESGGAKSARTRCSSSPVKGDVGPGMAYKQAMLRQYRSNRGGLSPSGGNAVNRMNNLNNLKGSGRANKLPFDTPVTSEAGRYDGDPDNIRVKAANFDYKSYVERSRRDKDSINMAILADALHDYDPNN